MMEFQEFWKLYKRMCDKHSTCENCPMNGMRFDCNGICVKAIEKNPQQAEQIVEQWTKEHPVVTNGDKFREVFGETIKYPFMIDKEKMLIYKIEDIFNSAWLNQEYKEPEKNA